MENDEGICPDVNDCAEELKLPGMIDMAKNLMRDGSKIVSNAVTGHTTFVSEEIKAQRWSICQQCPKLQNDRCVECGCFMKVKVVFVTSKCPLEKW